MKLARFNLEFKYLQKYHSLLLEDYTERNLKVRNEKKGPKADFL